MCDWFMSKTMAEQVKWSVAFESTKMEKGEEPMKYFGRIDKIVGVLASLGVVKTVAGVKRKIIMSLTSYYEMEERPVCTVRMSPERRSKASSDSGTCAFPRRRARTWTRLYFRMALLEVVVQVQAGIEVTVSQDVEMTQQARTARVGVAVTPQPPHKISTT